MDLIPHLLEHALEDTIYLVPFLFVTYFLLEVLEHKAGNRAANLVRKAGIAGPLVGALLGAVPQCGFSAAGAALYASRAVTLGTLFAVFLSTSDEMLPIFIAEQVDPVIVLSIIGSKVVIGMIMGFAVDATLRFRLHTRLKQERATLAALEARSGNPAGSETTPNHSSVCTHSHGTITHTPDEICSSTTEKDSPTEPVTLKATDTIIEQAHEEYLCDCEQHHRIHEAVDHAFSNYHCHNHGCTVDDHHNSWKDITLSAVKHTLQVSIIIYLISLALVSVMELAGEDVLSSFLAANPGIAIVGSALVGLIPNCGASVIITQLYLDGMLGTGAMMSGLLVACGVGLLVLFGENHRPKQNILILAGLVLCGVVWGCLFEIANIHFM